MIREVAKVVSNEKCTCNVYELVLLVPSIARDSKVGQFVNVYCNDPTNLLPRPISISQIEGDKVVLLYRVVGSGTKEFTSLKENDEVNIMGPIGHGFTVCSEGKIAIVGGGIGIAPMIELAKLLTKDNTNVYLGIGTSEETGFIKEEFFKKECSKVKVATMDGTYGTKGTVMDILENETFDMLYACGPLPMLKALKKYVDKNNIKAEFSLEERMGCGGLGTCLSCVCKIKVGNSGNWEYKKVCSYGPIVDAKEVLFDD
ncbi:MAG TPA: dihydroorotate dehydrogenase electron transfer subunit [Clostridiales bacterium]|nr:MAG: hypothetical protein A2Y22_04980 [Clostridiales bacterium GWD2_32_59]HAN10094.1 dihydroorotate dehydrogenase electron transfer subunit [Clostridiales bacterium]